MESSEASDAASRKSGRDAGIGEQFGNRLTLSLTASSPRAQPYPLRPYQADAIAQIQNAYAIGARRVLLQLPTGGGKTEILSHAIASAVARGKRILVLTHRAEILEQICRALGRRGVGYGVIGPDHRAPAAGAVHVASMAALSRRLDRYRDAFDFVVVDEAHHSASATWTMALASQSKARILGVSATPERTDGRGLDGLFDRMIVGPGTAELIDGGFLVPTTVYTPAHAPDLSRARTRAGDYAVEGLHAAMGAVVVGAAVDEYLRLCRGTPAVAFCIDISHSEAVAQRFREAGVRARHVDGKTPPAKRRAAIAALGAGALDVLCNCGLFSEGVDVPGIGTAILLRPTQSLGLYLQQVGRALRPAPGKDRALILDFAGNVGRHGMPDAPREWTLEARARRFRERSAAPRFRRCVCGALAAASAQRCIECGESLRTPEERREVAIRLRQLEQRDIEARVARMSRWDKIQWAGADEGRLRLVARLCAFRPGWVYWRRKELLDQRGAR